MMPGTGNGLRCTDEREYMFERYARQIIMPEIGVAGQKKLRASHVLVAGVGGLGSFSSLYLAAIGIGCLTLIDSGSIAMSDLNRQVLYSMETLGQRKVDMAATRLREFNRDVVVEPVFEKMTESSLYSWIKDVDAVVDATDNFKTRRILNRVCYGEGVPLIYGGYRA
jgi:adenylyltransferase/sulfurtransferase